MELAIVRTLEDLSLNAWPDLGRIHHDGWIARYAEGVTGRANSLNAIHPGATPVEAIEERFAAFYASKGLKPSVRLTPLCPPQTEGVFMRRGYAPEDATSTEIAEIDPALGIDPAVRLDPRSDAAWREAYTAASSRFAGSAAPIIARIHQAIMPKAAFARLEVGGVPLALGLAVVDGRHVGLQEIATMPEARGRGLGRRLVASLMAWGRSQGATHAWLQVAVKNEPARALYRGLGFVPVYEYVYLRK